MGWAAEKIRRIFRLDDPEGIEQLTSSGGSSNIYVNSQSALQISSANACIQLISRTVGTLPLSVYKRENDGRVVDYSHPVHQLLKVSPNAEQTPSEFKKQIAAHLNIHGNFYARKSYLNGNLTSLNPLNPKKVNIERLAGGMLEYVYQDGSKRTTYSERDILHIKSFCLDGEKGVSPVHYGAGSVGSAIAADNSAGKFFANGMQASGVLETDTFFKDDQREQIRKSIIEPLSGSANTGKTMVLEGGMKYKQLTLNPEDAQLLETRRFNIEEICRWYGVPPVLVGHAADGQTMWGSGVEQVILIWLKTGLESLLTDIEEALEKRLLTPAERKTHSIKFNLNKLLRADSAARAEYFSKGLQNGWLHRNEVRGLEDMKEIGGLDTITVQSNLIPIDQLGKVAPTQTSLKEK